MNKQQKKDCVCIPNKDARDCLELRKRPAGIDLEQYDYPDWISPYESCECKCHDKPDRPLTQDDWEVLVKVFGH